MVYNRMQYVDKAIGALRVISYSRRRAKEGVREGPLPCHSKRSGYDVPLFDSLDIRL